MCLASLGAGDLINICEGTYERFKRKDDQQMKIKYLVYFRSGPEVLQHLFDNVVTQKKSRYVRRASEASEACANTSRATRSAGERHTARTMPGGPLADQN